MIPDIHPVIIVLVLPAIIGMVTLLKDIGLPTKAAGPVAVVLGVVLSVSFTLWGEHPVFLAGLIGILLGLGASGFYDLSKLFGGDQLTDLERVARQEYLDSLTAESSSLHGLEED